MHQSNGGTEVVGRYRPESQQMAGSKHSEGFDRALDDAMKQAKLPVGTHHRTITFRAEITVTNPPGITEYIIHLAG
jgi:hypothetical protein